MPVVQRHQDADDPMQRGDGVAQTDSGAHGHATRFASQMAKPRHGLGDGGESGQVFVGASLAVAADAAQDQSGVASRQRVVAKVPGLEHSRLEVLDDDIGLVGELANDVACLRVLQVERHALLVARLHLPPYARAFMHQPPLAQRVTAGFAGCGRRLDLDHLGAEVGERARGKGAGDQLTEFDHLESGERTE